MTLLFVLNQRFPKSRHERELLDAQCKSHAARIGHARRKRTPRKKGRKTLAGKTTKPLVSTSSSDELTNVPPPLILAGNSDPFSALALKVTPQVNFMLTFLRDVILPAVYNTPFFRSCSPDPSDIIDLVSSKKSNIISFHNARRDWLNQVSWLQDEGLALAALAVVSDLIPKIMTHASSWTKPSFYRSLHMRARSTQLLREKIDNDESHDFANSDQAMLHAFLLLRAEHSARNYEAVNIHGVTLRRMVERAVSEDRTKISFLVQCLVCVTEHSVKNMCRTVFDVDDWCLKIFEPVWDYTYSVFPKLPDCLYHGVSETVDIEPLRSAIAEIRCLLYFSKHPFRASECYEGGPADLSFSLLCTRALVDLGRLVNLYLDLIDDTKPLCADLSLGRRHTQAGLALTTIFNLRSWGTCAILNGVDLRDASPTIMAHLWPCVQRMLSDCTPRERLHYRDAHLWILYSGSLWEHRQRILYAETANNITQSGVAWVTDSTPCRTKFTSCLVGFCNAYEINSLDKLQEIESTFVQTDLLQPHAAMWFEETISRRVPTEGVEEENE